ncbi:MAG: hypothetical protein J6T29_01720 [Alphaproteobacteria bacterium]|nr:hypothetical protein [Alphaproteobacteria bacterium]
MQNQETHYLINGQWANGISKEDQEFLELIPDYIKNNSETFFKEHQIKLLDATTYEDDPSQESGLWALHFQAHTIHFPNPSLQVQDTKKQNQFKEFFIKLTKNYDVNNLS